MEKAIEQIELLTEAGKKFTYDNFSTKSQNGYPQSFSPEWVAWQTRVKSIIVKLFGQDSAQNQARAASSQRQLSSLFSRV